MKPHFALALAGLLLAGCAESTTKPVVLQILPAAQQSGLLIAGVTGEAAPGVVMLPPDIDRITQSIRIELGGLVAPADPRAVRLRIIFTRYDSGSAAARALLIGLGQIHLDGEVQFLDTSGNIVGRYLIAKQFALGGIAGAVTSMSDVEKGFEASVVELVNKTRK